MDIETPAPPRKHPRRPRLSIDARLAAAQIAIDNALSDAALQTALARYGYNAARIKQGKELYTAVLELNHGQKVQRGEQFAATSARRDVLKQADATYTRLFKVARIAFRHDRNAAMALGLDGARKQTLSGWIGQARQFYTNALASPSLLAKLGTFGITSEILEDGQAEVTAVEMANAHQKQERGAAQASTEARDAALRALEAWHTDFIAIAKIALEDQPQLLEKMGIVARA